MKKIKLQTIAAGGILAALYAVLTIATTSISYGPVQFRIAEALSVLCCFSPPLGAGITMGCLLANLFSPVSPLDVLIGTAATALSCFAMSKIRKFWLMPLPNVLINGLVVGSELALVYSPEAFFPGLLLHGGQVALGELVVMVVLGIPLYIAVERSSKLQKCLAIRE